MLFNLVLSTLAFCGRSGGCASPCHHPLADYCGLEPCPTYDDIATSDRLEVYEKDGFVGCSFDVCADDTTRQSISCGAIDSGEAWWFNDGQLVAYESFTGSSDSAGCPTSDSGYATSAAGTWGDPFNCETVEIE